MPFNHKGNALHYKHELNFKNVYTMCLSSSKIISNHFIKIRWLTLVQCEQFYTKKK